MAPGEVTGGAGSIVLVLPDGWAVKSVRVDRRDVTDIPVDLGDAEAPRHLEIVLTNRVANASVRVTDEQGQADTSYRLVILPAPELKGDEVRVEWADGGVALDRDAVEQRIGEAVKNYLARGGTPAAGTGV